MVTGETKVREKDENKKDIDKILKSINDKYRKTTKDDQPLAFIASDREDLLVTKFIPTNVPEINEALGGGFPKNGITALTGVANSGKTALALSAAAEVQKSGGYTVYVNAEPPFPKDLAKMLGIDVEKLIILDPKDYGEQLIDSIHEILFDNETRTSRGVVDLIIVDSINGLVPKSVVDKIEEKGSESIDIGVRARMLTKFLEHIQGRGMLRSGVALIIIAQMRVDINSYGAPAKMSGGKAMEYMPKIVLKLTKKDIVTKESGKNVKVGHTVNFSVEKNSISGFPVQGEYNIVYGIGVDDSAKVLEDAVEAGHVKKEGRSSFIIDLGDETITIEGGIAALREKIREDKELKNKLKLRNSGGKE